jgi:hypothetical protein
MDFKSYYKLPAAQTPIENCVAHNGSLIPIPGRDVMVQAWYQGGISMFDWTDAAHPREIGYHDRGPSDATKLQLGGSWSVYWYNGVIVSSEIQRGLDIFELTPSAVHLAERDRCGEDGARRLQEHAGSDEARLAAELLAGARVRRSAGALERPVVVAARRGARGTGQRGVGLGCGAHQRAHGARDADRCRRIGLRATRRR